MKAPLLAEASLYKLRTTENKNIGGSNFQFLESGGETPNETPGQSQMSQHSEMMPRTNSEVSRSELVEVLETEQEKSDMESQMVLVTHGTQDDNSSDEHSVEARAAVTRQMNTLPEAENETDSQEEHKA